MFSLFNLFVFECYVMIYSLAFERGLTKDLASFPNAVNFVKADQSQ